MIFKKIIFFLLASIFIFSCGIEENYYLPQVPQNRIIRTSNTEAAINLPPIDNYYYALNYTILYRIYISGENLGYDIQTSSERNSISSDLNRDYEAIFPSTDPVTTASSNGYNMLKNRSYFELELDRVDIKTILQKEGGRLNILFPTVTDGFPTMSLNDGLEINLRRSRELISPQPVDDPSFRNSPDLGKSENANPNINADVTRSSSGSTQHAYVSMYIIAVGLDPSGFTPIYSKPTFISIFKLPNNY